MGGNSEAILSHTTNQLHFYKLILQNFTLDRNIMVHNTTNISSKSGCGLINAEALLGGDTTSVHIKSITTDHDITNTVRGGGGGGRGGGMNENVRPTLNHWIIQNADQHDMINVKLCPKTETSNVSE